MNSRKAAVAGSFYPASEKTLGNILADFINQAKTRQASNDIPKAIIVPHAGYVYSGPIAASAYAGLLAARGQISRVVLLGPSHREAFIGLAACTAESYSTPLGNIFIDQNNLSEVLALPQVITFDQAHQWEHSLEVQLPFLQFVLGEFLLLPLVVGEASADEVAGVLKKVWGGKETLIVISTDLSHYLPYDQARQIDQKTAGQIVSLSWQNISREQACGMIPVRGLLKAASDLQLQVRLLDLRNSGDTAGNHDQVVGYGAFGFYQN